MKAKIKVPKTVKAKKLKSNLIKIKKQKKSIPSADAADNESPDEIQTNDFEESSIVEKSEIKSKVKSLKKKSKQKLEKNEVKKHKKELEQLKDIDPEFYQFLKQNDKKLLEFNFYDDSDEESRQEYRSEDQKKEKRKKAAEDDDGSDNDEEELVHKPSGELEVASDESDFQHSDSDDEEKDDSETKTVTLKLLKQWQLQLQEKHPRIEVIRKVIQAFSSALSNVSEVITKSAVYKVEGSAAFNGIVQLCVMYLQTATLNFLGVSTKSEQPLHKCKKWKKVQSSLRGYLLDLVKLLEHVSSTNILTVLLKHLHQMGNVVASFPTISKSILKRLIVLWSTSEETVRVLSFLCILKITRNQQGSLLNHVLKAMYLSYVRNSKFVSPTTLPGINFMRRSLVEMFALDLNLSYQHVFLYIRQLAIHLRNAIILKKKDSFQAVYNWQFVNSIRLWSDLLGATAGKPQLEPLIYPLVSITTGVIKLIPTAQFFPLRFHCIQALISLQRETNVFIPVLPFIFEVMNSNTFNKKHTVVSMRPMQFTCILRLNKSQMAENGFRDEVIENICGLTLQYLDHESASLSFPDLVVPTVCFLKKYLKECKNSNHIRKLKLLLDKIIENSKYIEEERRKITFSLKDVNDIRAWETTISSKGTPLSIYYSSWVKTHETKKRRQAADSDNINDYDIPFIKRKKPGESDGKQMSDDGEVELFPSDDEEDEQLIVANKEDTPRKRKDTKKKEKKQKQVQQSREKEQEVDDDFNDDGIDIVKDLDIDDW